MEMYCIKVSKLEAQKVKLFILKNDLLHSEYKIETDKDYIYFPLTQKIKNFNYCDKKLAKIEKMSIDLSSFDHIGDIIIVQEGTSQETAKKIMKQTGVKVVLMKTGIHKGEFRTQDLEYLAGEKRKETVYKESGTQMRLNVETSYFSPRLSNERLRIAKLVQKNEKILVLFSGVGPYPLVLAKKSNPISIVAVEKNPQAHIYATYNCRKFKKITCVNLDAKDYVTTQKFDRVLMPLPKSAEDFLSVAINCCKPKGTIHFYDFIHESDYPNASLHKIKKHAPNFNLLSVNLCGKYAPGKYRICVDFQPN
jgi:tRNA (guanine37-N1)-methyltransferase